MSNKQFWVGSLLLLFVFRVTPSFSQSADATENPYRQQYEKGIAFYNQKNYEKAIETFRFLSRTGENNPYVIYASLHFAMAAFQSGDYSLAKNMLLQIKSKYPKWSKTSDVDYWLANTYFELGDYKQALALLKNLDQQKGTTRSTLEDAAKMKEYYIAQVTEPDRLQAWLADYPDDKVIATQLVERLLLAGNDEQTSLKDSLVQAFQIDEASFGIATQASSIKKDVYNVAAFLPFFYNKLTLENDRVGNDFVLETYQGMRMAVEDLQQEGINVQLYAYDTERDYDVTKRLLETEEIKGIDVIVGPLYPGPFRAVSEFSLEQQVYMFNPISVNPLVTANNPFSFLTKPSTITEAQRAASYASDTLNRKVAIVVTDDSKQDSARVAAFIDNFKKDETYEVHLEVLRSFNEEAMESLADTLVYFAEAFGEEREEAEAPVVYVASNNDLIITNTISAVVMANVPLTLFGNDSWFDITSVTYEQLEELDVHFLSAGYMDYKRGKVQEFTNAYKQEFSVPPSKYAYAGYDAMYYIGQMLGEYGIYFQEFYTDNQPVNSIFFEGYNFFEANDNQRIPIMRFEEGVLQEAKPESE